MPTSRDQFLNSEFGLTASADGKTRPRQVVSYGIAWKPGYGNAAIASLKNPSCIILPLAWRWMPQAARACGWGSCKEASKLCHSWKQLCKHDECPGFWTIQIWHKVQVVCKGRMCSTNFIVGKSCHSIAAKAILGTRWRSQHSGAMGTPAALLALLEVVKQRSNQFVTTSDTMTMSRSNKHERQLVFAARSNGYLRNQTHQNHEYLVWKDQGCPATSSHTLKL